MLAATKRDQAEREQQRPSSAARARQAGGPPPLVPAAVPPPLPPDATDWVVPDRAERRWHASNPFGSNSNSPTADYEELDSGHAQYSELPGPGAGPGLRQRYEALPVSALGGGAGHRHRSASASPGFAAPRAPPRRSTPPADAGRRRSSDDAAAVRARMAALQLSEVDSMPARQRAISMSQGAAAAAGPQYEEVDQLRLGGPGGAELNECGLCGGFFSYLTPGAVQVG